MKFSEVLGLDHIKNHLIKSTNNGRISHAQLLSGKEGSGLLAMAIAYAQYILASSSNNPEISDVKCEKLMHPDLHFAFPVATNDKIKSKPVSNLFLNEWREFVKLKPYGNLFEWLQSIGIENKQGQIGVDEAEQIVKALKLKSYEGGYKVMIIWMAEKMNNSASNKLLKLLEEPPKKTVFLLITEDEEQILQTIRSRCQILHFPPLAEAVIADALVEKGLVREEALRLAHEANGNFNKAIDLMNKDSEDLIFEKWFVQWVRSAFKAKGNKAREQG